MWDKQLSGKRVNLANGCLRPCLNHHKKCDKENKGWSATNWIKDWCLGLISSCLDLPMFIKISKNGNREEHQENLEDTMEEENPP